EERLTKIFEEKFACQRRRSFDGSFLSFPGMNPAVKLYPYQKNAVARILFSPNTLLAHSVGAGKTYIVAAAVMELRRMGLAKKSLIAVPGSILGQWKQIFLSLYPTAKLLCVEPKSFTPAKKQQMLKTIRDGDFDAIIMAHSCFERIEVSKQFCLDELEEKRRELEEALKDPFKKTATLERRVKKIKQQICDAVLNPDSPISEICFDELGINRLFIDEAHAYKNLPLETKVGNVLGINSGGSQKCVDVLEKVRVVQRQNDGGGVILATGTPITNSITEAYVIQKYLQPGDLALLELESFDAWIGLFAEKRTEFEIDVDTSKYRLATRFSRFHNLPELTSLLSSVADFHRVENDGSLPKLSGRNDCTVTKTAEFDEYLKDISRRADAVRSGKVPRTEDNMLKITTDGRRAALDLRLVNPTASFSTQSKLMRLCENVYDIYDKTRAKSSTQLVFCDSSTPKRGFNLYDEIKRLLMSFGIPEEHIAFVHNADTERKRNALFAKVRKGEVRVLLGSTFKLGTGVNVQDKLIALHHFDAGWRPSDMTQREGRIIRQGNENERVFIFRYITEGSFDAYTFQLLHTKADFICSLLSGAVSERNAQDISDTVLDYAEVKALAVGNPLIKERIEVANEISRLGSLNKKLAESRTVLASELEDLPELMEHQREVISKCATDVEMLKAENTPPDAESRRSMRAELAAALNGNELATTETPLFSYRGFELVLPSGMRADKPYLWLVGEARYYLELGDSEVGYFIRIDNFLDNLGAHLDKLNEGLATLEERQRTIRAELDRDEGYSEKISELTERLAKIDGRLGIKQ
ncbi:MAG: DEAD/DEAH box helicase family protein, partial [Clostridia bacterium]|nr:DEAD/DEAH box helicase family protein [Clostridia bacterium]